MILRNCWNSSLQRKVLGAPAQLALALPLAVQVRVMATQLLETVAAQSVAAVLAETTARPANSVLPDQLA
jgi:hypothetical protein